MKERAPTLSAKAASPFYPGLWMVLISGALSLWLFRGFWSAEVFLAGRDTFSHDYLMWDWGWGQFLQTGGLPFWNPWLFGGFPFVASFAFCPFYPPAWPCIALPTSLALTGQYALHNLLGAWGFYFLGRCLGLKGFWAVMAGLLFQVSAHPFTLVFPGHLSKVQALAWLPWITAFTRQWVWKGRFRDGAGLTVSLALPLLASHAQIAWTGFVLAGIGGLFGALTKGRRRGKGWAFYGKVWGGMAAFFFLALMVAAPQLLPGWEMSRHSNRSGGVALEQAVEGAFPAEEWAEIFLPSFRGDSTGQLLPFHKAPPAPYLGRWNQNDTGHGSERLVSDYLGVWVFLFALAGLFTGKRALLWGGMGLFFFGVSLGPATPLFEMAWRGLPGFRLFRSPATFLAGFHLCLMTLAILGIRQGQIAFVKRRRPGFLQKGRLFLALMVATLALLWAVALWKWGRLAPADSMVAMDRHFWKEALLLFSWKRTAFFALAGGLCLFAAWNLKTFWPRFLFLGLFVALAIGDGAGHIRHFLPRDKTQNLEHYLHHYPVDKAINRLSKSPLTTALENRNAYSNRFMMQDLRSLYGYHPIVFQDYEKLLRASGYLEADLTARLLSMNFRIVPSNQPPQSGWGKGGIYGGKSLLQRKNPLPAAWVPERVIAIAGRWADKSEAFWQEQLQSDPAIPRHLVLAEEGYQWTGKFSPVEMEFSQPDKFILRLPADSPHKGEAQMIPAYLPIPAAPGWECQWENAEGKKVKNFSESPWPRRCNGFLMLVPLSGDPDTVTVVTYHPPGFGTGLVLAGVAILVLLAGLFLDRKTGKRVNG